MPSRTGTAGVGEVDTRMTRPRSFGSHHPWNPIPLDTLFQRERGERVGLGVEIEELRTFLQQDDMQCSRSAFILAFADRKHPAGSATPAA